MENKARISNKIDTLFIRFALAIIMLMHSLPSFVTMDVLNFGSDYLAHHGFGILGVPTAILIKLIQLLTVPALVFNRYVKICSVLNIVILVTGIVMIHFDEGWYVVGGGRNGVEFNFLLIFIYISFLLPNGVASIRHFRRLE